MTIEEGKAAFRRHIAAAGCFGCSLRNAAGLSLVVEETHEGVTCSFTIDVRHQSYPGVVHGGIVSTVLDELMAHCLAEQFGRLTVCTALRMRFIEPVRTGHGYVAAARSVAGEDAAGPSHRTQAEIFDSSGAVVASATGRYHWLSELQAKRCTTMCDATLAELRPMLRPAGASDESF